MSDTARPLVTFALVAYNQAPYVRRALEAALAQTYSPLEIIVSDDASSDTTAEIIRETISTYAGPHAVRVNVNAANEGIASHVNRMFAMARGKLLVVAAGDDISHPSRVDRIFQVWNAGSTRPLALQSAANVVDVHGNVLAQYRSRIKHRENDAALYIKHFRGTLVLGATAAYDTELYARFGPLPPDLPVEDVPLAARAAMLGRMAYVDEPLVDYRVGVHGWLPHGGSAASFDKHREIRRFKAKIDYFVARQVFADAAHLGVLRFIRLARARLVEAKYAAHAAATGKIRVHEMIAAIAVSRRLFPTLALALLFRSAWIDWLYFSLNRRFRAERDSKVFRADAGEH